MSDSREGREEQGRPRSRGERIRLALEGFEELVGLAEPERVARLEALRAEDLELARELEAMLAADARSSTPMTVGGGLHALARISASEVSKSVLARSFEAPLPVLAGQYRILRRIGEGGMGVVYEAEQALPRRKVALKAIRGGLASRQILRRFEQEAHILGRLHHPGIAQVYEAGANDPVSGDQAFIAMELVEGEALDVWARGRSLREKAELLARACDAVQHAHQRRVVHRDLKPANLLVDRSGQPKILDFGVARLADDAREEALRTRAGQLVGTLAYMSPEQTAGDPDEVDARADVYALGVMLYELLAGRLPHPPEGRTLPELALAIQNEEPPRLARLVPDLPRDLDFIAGKALAKERERRYQSAHELALDLRRWLVGAPVSARGDSALYVLRRVLRRHRWVALTSALAVLSLVAFAVNAKLGQRRAGRDARELASVLRASRIELGRMMALSGNLAGAEQLIWDAHLEREDLHSRWALRELYAHFPCLRALPGHTDSVLFVAYAPGGELVASGSHDRTVRVWDWTSGECLRVLPFDGFIAGLGFAEEGRALVAALWSGELLCWDARSGEERWRSREAGLPRIVSFALAPQAALAACVGQSPACALIDLASGALRASFPIEGSDATAVALDPAAAGLAVGCYDGSVRRLDPRTGAELARLAGHASPVTSLAFVPGEERVASGDTEGVVLIHSLVSLEVEQRFESGIGAARSLSFAPRADLLLAACASGVELWERASGARLVDRPHLRQTAFSAIFAPQGTEIVAGSIGGPIRVWELESRSHQRTRALRVVPGANMNLAAGAGALAREAEPGVLELVDLDGELLARWPSGAESVEQVTADPPAKRLAALSRPSSISIWSLPTTTLLTRLELPEEVVSLRFAPDGERLAVEAKSGRLRLFDSDSGALLLEREHPSGSVQRMSFHPDGRRLATTHARGRIELWNLERGELERTFESSRQVFSITVDPRGELIHVGTWDGRVQLFDIASGRLLRTLEAHSQRVLAIVPTRDGALSVTTGGDGLLRLWNPRVDSCLLTLDAGAGVVLTYGFSSDERSLRAVHGDGSVREWDLTHFDRHVAGNEPLQRALRAAPR